MSKIYRPCDGCGKYPATGSINHKPACFDCLNGNQHSVRNVIIGSCVLGFFVYTILWGLT